jgi:hypothetical protein
MDDHGSEPHILG